MKINLWVDHASFNMCITFYQERHDGVYVYNPFTRELHKLDNDIMQVPDEFIAKLPRHDDTIKNLMEAISNLGIKTDNDHKIQGTLEATKYHLEDMRSLLKLQKGASR